MAALKDNFHRPRDPVIGDDAKAWVVHLACSKPKDLGYAAEVWSRQALARHVREHAGEAGFPALVPRGQSDGTPDSGGTAAASREGPVLLSAPG
jgi:hypothetical protein